MSVHHWTGKYHHRDPAATVASLTPAGNDGWQPMETAPRDGRKIIVWDSTFGEVTTARWYVPWMNGKIDTVSPPYWDSPSNEYEYRIEPTAWRPMHEPPAGCSERYERRLTPEEMEHSERYLRGVKSEPQPNQMHETRQQRRAREREERR